MRKRTSQQASVLALECLEPRLLLAAGAMEYMDSVVNGV